MPINPLPGPQLIELRIELLAPQTPLDEFPYIPLPLQAIHQTRTNLLIAEKEALLKKITRVYIVATLGLACAGMLGYFLGDNQYQIPSLAVPGGLFVCASAWFAKKMHDHDKEIEMIRQNFRSNYSPSPSSLSPKSSPIHSSKSSPSSSNNEVGPDRESTSLETNTDLKTNTDYRLLAGDDGLELGRFLPNMVNPGSRSF